MGKVIDDYSTLMKRFKDLSLILSTEAIIQWDTETKLPPGAFELRAQQQALLSRLEHKMSTNRGIGRLLERVEKNSEYDSLNEMQKRNAHLIRKNYDEATKLPERLVSSLAEQQVTSYNAWKKAKAAKNFGAFKPELLKMFELKREAAERLMSVKGVSNEYDALIDFYEPKITQFTISRTFDELKAGLIPIIGKAASASKEGCQSTLDFRMPVATQKELSKSLAKYIGYDIESEKARGRVDETEHPFTTGYFSDVRITTHYFEDNFLPSLFSILHEGGHALYEQNMREDWIYQPIGTACSYGFHESQSRFVENMVGRSAEFWSAFFPTLKSLDYALADAKVESMVRAVNRVQPSKIRIEADEATYSMHIIIRFELERDLFSGKLSVEELPQAWNQKYSDYLGVEVKDDAEGVLQDVHWAQGYFGYFPSYALGNIYGGQLLEKLEKDLPQWKSTISSGNFTPIRQWLTTNVHAYGNLYNPLELLRRVTGEEIRPSFFLNYLDSKYREIFCY
jgi:carboxypeptidase Taq